MAKEILNIDIGNHSLKFLLTVPKKNKNQIKDFISVDIPDNLEEKEEYINQKIKEIIKEKRWTKNATNILYSSKDIIARGLKIPVIPKDEIDIVVKREIKKLYGDLKDKRVVYQIMGEDQRDDKNFYIVFFVLLPEEKIKLIENYDTKMESIDFTVFSIDRLFRFVLEEKENTMLLDFGHENVNLFIYKGKNLEVYREINIGGREVTQTIADVLQIDYKEAEKTKIEHGYVTKEESEKMAEYGDKKAGQLNFAYQVVMNKLIRKVQHSLDYFKSQNRGEDVTKIFIFGGGSKLKGLENYLKGEMEEKEIKYYSGIDRFEVIKIVDEFSEEALKYTNIMGTSMMQEPIMKLSQKREKKLTSQEIKKRKKIYMYLGVVASVLPIIMIYIYLYTQNKDRDAVIKQYEIELESKQGIVDEFIKKQSEMDLLTRELEILKKISVKDTRFSELFYKLSEITEERVYFTEINQKDNVATLKGESISQDGFPEIYINDLIKKLEKEYPFTKLINTKRNAAYEKESATFEIEIRFKMDGGDLDGTK